tara:strand:+ start:293 stop:1135 length:843 start_codon:yes stop_codon:yes gene_type:complete
MLVKDMLEDMKHNELNKFISKGRLMLGNRFYLGGITIDKDMKKEARENLKPHKKRWIRDFHILKDEENLDIIPSGHTQELVIKKDYDGFYPKFELKNKLVYQGGQAAIGVVRDDVYKLESECYKLDIEWQARSFGTEDDAIYETKGLDYDRLSKVYIFESFREVDLAWGEKESGLYPDTDTKKEWFKVERYDYDENTKLTDVIMMVPIEYENTPYPAVSVPVDKPIIEIKVIWRNVGKYKPEHFVDIIKACGVLSFNSLTFGQSYSGNKLTWKEKENRFW